MTNYNARADLLACLLELTDAHKYAHNPSARRAFHTALLDSYLYIPLAKKPKTRTGKIAFLTVHNNGHDHALLFSSIKTLSEFVGQQMPYTRVSARTALEQIHSGYALLNAGPFGRALRPNDISEILTQAIENTRTPRPQMAIAN